MNAIQLGIRSVNRQLIKLVMFLKTDSRGGEKNTTMFLSLQFPFEDNMFQSLFYPIQTKFLDTVNTLCGRIPQVFLKQIEKTMRKVFEAKVVRHVGHVK